MAELAVNKNKGSSGRRVFGRAGSLMAQAKELGRLPSCFSPFHADNCCRCGHAHGVDGLFYHAAAITHHFICVFARSRKVAGAGGVAKCRCRCSLDPTTGDVMVPSVIIIPRV